MIYNKSYKMAALVIVAIFFASPLFGQKNITSSSCDGEVTIECDCPLIKILCDGNLMKSYNANDVTYGTTSGAVTIYGNGNIKLVPADLGLATPQDVIDLIDACLGESCGAMEMESMATSTDSLIAELLQQSISQDSAWCAAQNLADSIANELQGDQILQDSAWCAAQELADSITNNLLEQILSQDSLWCVSQSIGDSLTNSLLEQQLSQDSAWCLAQSISDSLTAIYQDSMLTLIDSLIKTNIDYEIESIPYCLEGNQLYLEVVYIDGVIQPSITPVGATLGFCPSTDTTDFEVTNKFVCVNDTTVEVRTFWENGQEVATVFVGLANLPLEYTEGRCIHPEKDIVQGCLYLDDGNTCMGEIIVTHNGDGTQSYQYKINGKLVTNVLSHNLGDCNENKSFFTGCFLPDQYAIVWSWAGNGDITSYDPLTGITTYHGQSTEGGFALAFKNDVTEPTLYFQRAGQLWKASPDDPVGTFSLVGTNSLPAFPCFDFDPSGRLLAGNGNSAYEINPDDGSATFLGNLIDARDGANLSVSPGDWYYDPNGAWFMMARDNRGASFNDPNGNPYCTGTALWKINPATLVASRVNNSCAPVSGTGATWLAAGQGLLSTSGGQNYVHNTYTETWDLSYNADNNDQGQNVSVNDLASQWVIPDAVFLCGWKELDCTDSTACKPTYYEIKSNTETGVQECVLYESTLMGKWGVCEKEDNPFVSDPSQEDTEYLSDQNWNEGCSDAGFTRWRVAYDPSFNPICYYLYGKIQPKDATTTAPSGFLAVPCDDTRTLTETIEYCNLANDPPTTIFQKNFSDGTVRWFDADGVVTPAPTNVAIGACPDLSPLNPVTREVVCKDGISYVRVREEIYIEDPVTGLPELQSFQIIWYNEDGNFYDSGVLDPTQTADEPSFDYLGDCDDPFEDERNEKLCEFDSEKLLLIDSGGEFAEYDLNTGTYEVIPTLSVPSAGSGADPDNFVLYAITQAGDLQVVDVNTKTTTSVTPLFTNDASPLSFSAAHFYDGILYGYDTGANSLYAIDVNTAEVSFVAGPYTNDGNSGTSLAINPVDGKFYFVSSGGVFREFDPTGASLAMTIAYDAQNNLSNGATFDTNGNAYITQGNETAQISDFGTGNEVETILVDDFAAGANSMTYYKTEAQSPSCFHRRTALNTTTGLREYIGDFFIGTDDERIISGFIDCCECKPTESGGGGVTGPLDIASLPVETKSISELYICFNGVTAIEKTLVQSDGTEVKTYRTNNGTIITPPPATEFYYGECQYGFTTRYACVDTNSDGEPDLKGTVYERITDVRNTGVIVKTSVFEATDGTTLVAPFDQVECGCD